MYTVNMVIRLNRARKLVARDQSRLDSIDIARSGPHRGSTSGFTRRAGRNNRGIITSRHRGGGHKRLYRRTNFQRSKKSVPGKIVTVERDPNRGAHISLVHYEDGDKGYILHPEGLGVGDTITTGPDAPITIGNALPSSAVRISNSRSR